MDTTMQHISSQAQGGSQCPDSWPAAKGPEPCPAGPRQELGALTCCAGSEHNPWKELCEQSLSPPCLSQMPSPRNTTPPKWRIQLLRGPDGSQENSGRWTGPLAPPTKLRVSWAQEGACPGSWTSHLTTMREDDHHTAVQGTMVPPRQLHQSLDHLLQREGRSEPEHGQIRSPSQIHLHT